MKVSCSANGMFCSENAIRFNNDAAYLDVCWDEVMCLHVKLMVNPQTHA